jgi:DNA mismatch endonuclease (patch repair protein)
MAVKLRSERERAPLTRSENMSRIRSKHTRPEMTVRRLVYQLGFRYRLHGKEIPGKPDLVFRSRRSIIFVHGCFWHQHSDCGAGRVPRSNQEYWKRKLQRNVLRDRANLAQLSEEGWRVFTVWECQLADLTRLKGDLLRFLDVMSPG